MNLSKFRNSRLAIPVCLLILIFISACEHRPLEIPYFYDNMFVKVYIDENIRNVTYGFYDESKKKPEYSSPQALRVVFYDETGGGLVTERYLHECGRDEDGYYIQGYMSVPNGRYNIMAYNFDTKEASIKHDNTYYGTTAYTRPLTENEENRIFSSRGDLKGEEPICQQPDHLFVARIENAEVSMPEYWEKPDTLKTNEGTAPVAKSIVKTYYMQFNVKGVEHVRSAVALISGMAGSKKMHSDEMVTDDVASIYFGLSNGKDNTRRTTDDMAVAYASFNTFGKLPHTEGYIDITFEFKTVYNTVQTETFRVTDMFETEEVKEKQWIIIDKVIEIVPPEGTQSGGGMAPGVNDWIEIEGGITI